MGNTGLSNGISSSLFDGRERLVPKAEGVFGTAKWLCVVIVLIGVAWEAVLIDVTCFPDAVKDSPAASACRVVCSYSNAGYRTLIKRRITRS